MLEFNVFDAILDSTLVIDETGKIVYCNDAAANLCQTSVRRTLGKIMLKDMISFTEPGLLPFGPQSVGYATPSPLIETAFTLVKGGKTGKVQLTVRPATENRWVFFMHDVSLEETLAEKYRQELKKTEEYARSLEKMVEVRTAELRMVNQTLNAILDSLGQGFFTFNAQGECGDVFTKACESVLEGVPKGRKAWDALAVPDKQQDQFNKWMDSLFKEPLPFDDLKNLGPEIFPHSQNKHVTLEYYPIRREKDAISDVVVVATDKTAEREAQQALEAERQYAAMVVKYLKNKEQFVQFLSSVTSAIEHLRVLSMRPLTTETLNESLRDLHTIEGEAGTFSLRELRLLARESQQILEPFKGTSELAVEAQQSYVKSLNQMQRKFSEFLSSNGDVIQLPTGDQGRTLELPQASVQTFADEMKSAGVKAALLERYNELFCKVTLESRLKYFDGLIQNVAEKLGKKVKPMLIEGGDLRIFPEPYQKFFASLVHAFRNAVDHGLEEPIEREWGGKAPAGTIRVSVRAKNGQLHLLISDDGKGIDPGAIREKLKSKFPERDFTKQSDDEIIQNVTLPGFSSRDSVGEFSGRGVGLDAVREEVLNLGGTLRLKSKVGEGTTIEIAIPELGSQTGILRSA